MPVVPQPRSARAESGVYAWPSRVRIGLRAPEQRNAADQLRAYLAQNGVTATVLPRAAPADVTLEAPARYDARLGDEGYGLRVARNGVMLRANTARGAFYALQTLEQLTTRSGGRLSSRAVTIGIGITVGWTTMSGSFGPLVAPVAAVPGPAFGTGTRDP